jgi:hypothetical protein
MKSVLEFDFVYPWSDVQRKQFVALAECAVDEIIIHHTDSRDVSILSVEEESVEVSVDEQEIGRWHEDRGFYGPGYHVLIRENGNKEQGRPLNVQGAHAKNHNGRSWGVAVACDCTKRRPTAEQFQGLVGAVVALKAKRPTAVIKAHCEVCPTDCPGLLFPWDEFIEAVERESVAPWLPPPVKIDIKGIILPGIIMENGEAFGPVRKIIEALNHQVSWDGVNKIVKVI